MLLLKNTNVMPTPKKVPRKDKDEARQKKELIERIERQHALAHHMSARSAFDYLQHVVIDTRPQSQPFRLVAEPWQWDIAKMVIPIIESVAGVRSDYSGPRCLWLTLPKGHDKTSFIGRMCNWLLAYSKLPVTAYCAAADKEQAGGLKEAMQSEARLNPWLEKRLDFQTYEARGTTTNSRLKILAADAHTTHGIRSSLFICDEVTHWPKRDLWDALYTGFTKVPGAGWIVITNAGILNSWQHEQMLSAKLSPHWHVFEAAGRMASWMNEAIVEEQSRTLPRSVAARYFTNRWIDPSEDKGYVFRHEAQACEDLGVEMNLTVKEIGDPTKQYVAAVDYGPKKDRTCLCVVHRKGDVAVIDRMDVWQGSSDNHVSLERVEQWLRDVNKNFNLSVAVIDQYQMEAVLQSIRGVVPFEVFRPRGAAGNYQLAENLRSLVVNRKLAWPKGCGDVMVTDRRTGHTKTHTLVDEFAEVSIKTTTGFGYRLINIGNTQDDRVVSLGMAVLQLMQTIPKRDVMVGEHWW